MNTKRVYKSTMVELVDELEKLPFSLGVNIMIAEAKAGEYHDYKNQRYACGKMESSQRLRGMGYVDLARRIEQGEFDEEADGADIEMMRNDVTTGMPIEKANEFLKILGLGEK